MARRARDKRIDVAQEIIDGYARERMLAFFDFPLPGDGGASISGLCRISGPERDDPAMQYLSLSFVVDTPDDGARRAARAALRRTFR